MAAAVQVGAAVAALGYLNTKLSISEDLHKLGGAIAATIRLKRDERRERTSLFYLFEENAKKIGSTRECYVCEGTSWTWQDVDIQTRKIAHFLIERGVRRGDVISIFLPNKPAYAIIWLACLSLDVVPAFINYSLTGASLVHCIKTVSSSFLLFDSTFSAQVAEILPSLPPSLTLISWNDLYSTPSATTLPIPNLFVLDEAAMSRMSHERIGDEWRQGVKITNPSVYIFTSGTTGLPKAAPLTHGKVGMAIRAWPLVHGMNANSRVYTPMPIYHASAAILAIGVAWYTGSTIAVGRKFSATTFWDEVRSSNADTIQYVGEVLRYLLNAPPSPRDKDHNVKIAYGNGCRPDVWNKFRERFDIPMIAEFYSATEANVALFNRNLNTYGSGAIGHDGALFSLLLRRQVAILRVDSETEDPVRGKDGFCVRVNTNETGELVSRIIRGSAHMDFYGYHNNASGTEKKILRDVFVKGDAYFRSGDLMSKDENRFYYFKDRQGDTFRWKGENVATTEVAEVLGEVVSEANVYGVLLPAHDGRAGCAAIPMESASIDLDRISAHVIRHLPSFAQPLFLRLVPKLESTGTAKQVKVALRTEGVDPDKVGSDKVYWLQHGRYVPFERKDWIALTAGKVKL